jgi:hypothetical protein
MTRSSYYTGGEQALLRIAMWFWNGMGALSDRDVGCLDNRNRARFVRAMAHHLRVML